MANERILDAAALLAGKRWAFAYYVAGYAVECALKSCILARMILTGGVFKEKKFAERCFTHDFAELVDLAGLKPELDAKFAASAAAAAAAGGPPGGAFAFNWGVAIQWKETSRYESRTEPEAVALHAAITADPDGVLQWVQNFW